MKALYSVGHAGRLGAGAARASDGAHSARRRRSRSISSCLPAWCCRCRGAWPANEQRAVAAAQAEADANTEFRQAEAVREGKSPRDDRSRDVLPAGAARPMSTAARRIVAVKLQQLAREHDVQYERGATDTEEIRDSSLERFTVSMTLSGDYDDIRALHLRRSKRRRTSSSSTTSCWRKDSTRTRRCRCRSSSRRITALPPWRRLPRCDRMAARARGQGMAVKRQTLLLGAAGVAGDRRRRHLVERRIGEHGAGERCRGGRRRQRRQRPAAVRRRRRRTR